MRVYDMAMRADVPEGTNAARALKEITQPAVVVHAQTVWDWFTAQRQALKDGEDVLRLIERCVPPFGVTMVEYEDHRDKGWHVGVVVYRDAAEVGHVLHASFWMTDFQRSIAAFPGFASLPVSPDGVPDWSQYKLGYDDDATDQQRAGGAEAMAEALAFALLAFRFMHARGVEMRETVAPRHERRRAEKEGKPAPVTYKTLEITGMTRTLATEGDIATNGIAKAMHLCRGHFADYTKGSGLFGRYRVEVFVPDHVRGRKQRGVIVKDYTIVTPKEPRP